MSTKDDDSPLWALVVVMIVLGFAIVAMSVSCEELSLGGHGGVGIEAQAMVYRGSPECGDGVAALPPPRETTDVIQGCVAAELRQRALSGALRLPGAPWPPDEVERVLAVRPLIAWYDRPLWVNGWVGTDPECQPCWVCAAGVAGWPHISVSLRDESRVLRLVAWETANYHLTSLGRWDEWDGAVPAAITDACAPR